MINIKNEKFLKKLGLRLRQVRKDHGFTQESLAHKCDLSLSQIGRIERGKINPTISTLQHIAKSMKISISELLSGL